MTRIASRVILLHHFAAASLSIAAHAAQAQEIRYTIENLGVLPGDYSSVPTSINTNGDVVGWSTSGPPRAFLYTDDQGMVQLPNLPNRTFSVATAISDTGIITGYGYTTYGDFPGHAWRIVNGEIEDLGTLGGTWSAGRGVNDAGTVVGYSYCGFLPSAFLRTTDAPMIELTGSCAYSYGEAINNSNVVTGSRSTGDGWRAYRWTQNTGFAYPPPLDGFAHAYGFAINEHNQIAGKARTATGNDERMIRYTGTTVENLGGVGQDNTAWAINIHGDVVGEGRPTGGIKRAMIYTDARGLEDLNLLIDPDANWFLLAARGINDAGQIVCSASNTITGESRALRLTPIVTSVPGDINGDGAVDVQDLLILLSAWGPCTKQGDCPADLNGDGVVDVSDLLILLGNWG
jgi:probable HAF family extracellular repeat protein